MLLCISINSFSQVTVTGQSNPSPGAQEYYEATFDYTLHPYANISWTVTGGTIISQNINPTATPIWCIVEWDNTAGTGSIILNEDLNGGYAELQVQFGETQQSCEVANAGSDVTISCGGSAVIGTSAVTGYSYSWRPTSGFPLYPSGLSNPNIAQPTASPTSFKTYTLTVTAQDNLIANSDFEEGMSGFYTDYGTYPNGIGCIGGGVYGSVSVVTDPSQDLGNQYCSINNYSTNGTKSLFVDGSCTSNLRFWYQTITIQPNTTYYFSGFFTAASTTVGYNAATDAGRIKIKINGTTLINDWINAFSCNNWTELAFSWNSGSATSATIEMINDNLQKNMNDFCMDGLYFGLCPRSTDQVNVFVQQNPIISPSGTQTICSEWEGISNPAFLSTNLTSNIQWYRNGTAIPGATSPNYTAYAQDGQGIYIKSYSYTVRSTATGCPSNESSAVIVNFVPSPYIRISTGTCRNSPIGLNAPNYGSGVTYSWSIPGATITPNSSSREIQVSFPSSYSSNNFTAMLTTTNSYNCNGTVQETFYFSTMCRNSLNSESETTLFPNPANNILNVKSNGNISFIEIRNLAGNVVKQIKTQKITQTSINVNDLQEGVYSCRIEINGMTQYFKFLIKR